MKSVLKFLKTEHMLAILKQQIFVWLYRVPGSFSPVCVCVCVFNHYTMKTKTKMGKSESQIQKVRAKDGRDIKFVKASRETAKWVHKYIPTHCRLDSTHPANDRLMDIKRSWPSLQPPPPALSHTHTALCVVRECDLVPIPEELC